MSQGKGIERRHAAVERFKQERGALSHSELEIYSSGYTTGMQTGYQEGRLRERMDNAIHEPEMIYKSIGFGFVLGCGIAGGLFWLLWMQGAF